MAGIIVQLLLSWLIIRVVEKGNLSILGLYPGRQRVRDFALFFLLSACCSASDYLLKMYFLEEQWQLNPMLTPGLIAEGTWWNIKSVLFEELIFRGVLLYILIRKTGVNIAIMVSAVCFGVYHWFSQEVFGDIQQMVIVFIITSVMGLLYAYGYAKTLSLYIPCAIHLGWNLVRSVIFSGTSIGNQLLVNMQPATEVTVSYPVFFILLLFPMLSVLVLNFVLLKQRPYTISSMQK